MKKLLIFTLVGLVAQTIDGALGMAYGATSASLLVATGYSPVVASASIHLSEVGTTLASGIAHARFGNVDWGVVRRIAIPGGIGAFAGATVLSSIDGDVIKPWVAVILGCLGIIVLARFGFGVAANARRRKISVLGGASVGLVGGFVDAVGGGGWGPIATPTLLTATDMEPRKVIGSVDTSEFVVAIAASIGFFTGIGTAGIDLAVVGAMLAGGLVAAPFAAWLVRRVPPVALGVGVGGLLLLTNARTLVNLSDVDGRLVYLPILAVVAVAAVRSKRAGQWAVQASSESMSDRTDSGSDPSTTSASVTDSSTDRSEARTATHTEVNGSSPSS